MSVKSYALTTRQRLIDFLGLTSLSTTQETVLDRIIDATTEFIEGYIGQRVKLSTYTQELYSTDNFTSLLLKHFPVSSTAAFTLERRLSDQNEDDWETIDTIYYHIDYAAGIIYAASGFKFPITRNGYRVTYQAGFDYDNAATFLSDTTGGDLELAMWMLCAVIWNHRKSGGDVESESIGDYSVTYRKALLENEEITSLLSKYVTPSVGGVTTPYVY